MCRSHDTHQLVDCPHYIGCCPGLVPYCGLQKARFVFGFQSIYFLDLFTWQIKIFSFTDVNWGSTTQAQTYKNALTSILQLNNVEEHVKNYRPQILVLSAMPSNRPQLVDFAHLLTKNLSLLICGHVIKVMSQLEL